MDGIGVAVYVGINGLILAIPYMLFKLALDLFDILCSLQGKTTPTQRPAYFMFFSRLAVLSITVFVQNNQYTCWLWDCNLWQAAALAFYILSTLFVDSFVIIFVVTVVLGALDFWVVKNISGRILVGLRWWNEINEQGESVWKFECLDQQVRKISNFLGGSANSALDTVISIYFYHITYFMHYRLLFLMFFFCSHWLGWTKRTRGYFGGLCTLMYGHIIPILYLILS